MPAAWSDPRVWGGKQLGKSLGGFFPSWESSLKPRPARPRSQVSFEKEQAAAQAGRAGCVLRLPGNGRPKKVIYCRTLPLSGALSCGNSPAAKASVSKTNTYRHAGWCF